MNKDKFKIKKNKCSVCKTENFINIHYCINCGNNLSNEIELTDVLFFITNLINIIGILFLILIIMTFLSLNVFMMMFGANIGFSFMKIFLTFLIIFVINYFVRRYAVKRCKKNLDKNKEVNDGKD